jgi:hypothetical protein
LALLQCECQRLWRPSSGGPDGYGEPMDREELDRLLTPRLLAAVDAEPPPTVKTDVLARSTALRRAGYSAEETATILTQAKLRRRAVAKFGDFASRMLFTAAGLEQATRLDVAAHHASRFRALGARRLADLGCGIGGDALAFGAVDLEVLAVERDPVTAAIASYNLAPFPEVDVRVGDAESTDLAGIGAAWLDPARRSEGHSETHRVRAAEFTPSLDFAYSLAERIPVGVKLSPAHDRATLPEQAEAQWVSSRGEVVETALWFGDLRRPGVRRAALVVTDRGTAELTAPADAPDEPPGPLGGYLHEPDGAVIRARVLGDLARSTGTHPVGPDIAYLTGDRPIASPFVASFEIEAVLPFDRLRIRRELKARQVGRLEIKKRGVDLDPATFRTFLGLAGDGEATLIVTRTAERRVALICRRLGTQDVPVDGPLTE